MVFVSNLCYLIKLLQLFQLFYLHTLCCFSTFCRLIKFLTSYQNFVIFSPLAPAVHTTNTTLTLVLSSARSLHQYTFPNSTDVFGHRAILIWGDRGVAGGFLEEQPVILLVRLYI